MIFPKQFLVESLDRRYKQSLYQAHPYKSHFTEKDKSPGEIIISNYYTFFDKKSEEMKDLMFQARNEIGEKCFNQDVMDAYPNSFKIDQCIKNTEAKYIGKYYEKRNIFFGNSNYN
jgi:hypothetical protein